MNGVVSAELESLIKITLVAIGAQEHEIEASSTQGSMVI
jgi:hypothetical protein